MKINVKHNFNLNDVKKRLKRMAPEMIHRDMGIIMADISKGISTGRDIEGKRFKKLKPQTVKAKRRKGSAHPERILFDEGTMQETYPKQRPTKTRPIGIIKVANKRSGAISGYSKGVGQLHQEGGENHPARPWFGISPAAEKKMIKNRNRYILKALGKAWR